MATPQPRTLRRAGWRGKGERRIFQTFLFVVCSYPPSEVQTTIQNECYENPSLRNWFGRTRRDAECRLTRPCLCMIEAAAFKAHPTGSQIRPCRLLELHAQAGGSLQLTQGVLPLNAAICADDGLAGLLSLLLSHRLVRHDQTDHAGLGCAHLASESRTHGALSSSSAFVDNQRAGSRGSDTSGDGLPCCPG